MLLSTLCWVSLPQEILSGDQTEAVCQSAGPISLQPFGFSGGNGATPRESSPYMDESQQGQSEGRGTVNPTLMPDPSLEALN